MSSTDERIYREGALHPYIIFEWIQFENSLDWRSGAMNDDNLMNSFFQNLNFNGGELGGKKARNTTKDEFKKLIEQFVNRCAEKHANVKCISVFISSHGEEREVKEDDADEMVCKHYIRVKGKEDTDENQDSLYLSTMDDVIKPFLDNEVLASIPKIFFIQACSHLKTDADEKQQQTTSNVLDLGVNLEIVEDLNKEYTDLQPVPQLYMRQSATGQQADSECPINNERRQAKFIPPCGDNCLVVFSSPSKYKSGGGKDASKGSTLVRGLTQALKEIPDEHFSLLNFLMKANGILMKEERKVEGTPYKPLLRVIHQLPYDIQLKKKTIH